MTREEIDSLLEEAYLSGYNDAELDISNESNNVKKKIDEYKDTSLAGKERGIDGFTMYDPKKIKTQNKKWLNDADPHHTNQTMDGSNDFYFVRRNKGTNGKSSTPRGRIKVGNDDDLEYRMKKKFKGDALKNDIKELKSLREEFEALLEEAFMAGYEDATEEIFSEDSKQKNANKTLGRQLGGSAIPGSGIRGVRDINKRYRHANRQFIRLHKKVGEDSYEKDPKKVNTPDEKKKYNKLANKVTGLYDAREKYFKKSVDDLYTDDNFSDYLKKARKSPNLKARIISNDKYNKLNDKAKEFLKKKYDI